MCGPCQGLMSFDHVVGHPSFDCVLSGAEPGFIYSARPTHPLDTVPLRLLLCVTIRVCLWLCLIRSAFAFVSSEYPRFFEEDWLYER